MEPITYLKIKALLENHANVDVARSAAKFFKTEKGGYGEGTKFLGINVPTLRKLSKNFTDLSYLDLEALLKSHINEQQLLALFVLIEKYKKGDLQTKEKVFKFYLDNIDHINNWNLVDSSAPYIIGSWIIDKDKGVLLKLAKSENLWKKRIATVATLYFIRNNYFEATIKIAETLLNDKHDLIHKAVGWMLRELGKKNRALLESFLQEYKLKMPRTMLRYAIEKFDPEERNEYLKK